MQNSSLIENVSITYKTIIVFAIMGLISGSLSIATPTPYGVGVFLPDYPIIQEAYREIYDWLHCLVFGVILYITLYRYQLTKGNHWINITVLILMTAVGWYLAAGVVGHTSHHGVPSSEGMLMAGLTGAFCVAISLLWVCRIGKDKNNRTAFVMIVSAFGMIGAFIFLVIGPSNKQGGMVVLIWQSMVFMSIPVSLFLNKLWRKRHAC